MRASRILLSTRLYPAELQTPTAQYWPGCDALFIEGLSDDDALNLWRAFGVSGAREDLLPLFNAFGNYPLLLRALAGEVAEYRPAPGDFGRWRAGNPGFNPAAELDLRNAKTHVLEFALRGLGQAQRQVLYTLAGFRMPADWETVRDLFAAAVGAGHARDPEPAASPVAGAARSCAGLDRIRMPADWETVPDLFAAAVGAGHARDPEPAASPVAGAARSYAGLDRILTELEDRGLVGWDRRANRYDLHPIVRCLPLRPEPGPPPVAGARRRRA